MSKAFVFTLCVLCALAGAARGQSDIVSFDAMIMGLTYDPGEPDRIPQVSLNTITFKLNSAELTDQAVRQLEVLAVVLQQPGLASATILVEGHTCDLGEAAYNRRLSRERARSVVAWLEDAGIASNRMQSRGKGQSEPLAPNTSETNRRKNRRVVIKRTDIGGDTEDAPEPEDDYEPEDSPEPEDAPAPSPEPDTRVPVSVRFMGRMRDSDMLYAMAAPVSELKNGDLIGVCLDAQRAAWTWVLVAGPDGVVQWLTPEGDQTLGQEVAANTRVMVPPENILYRLAGASGKTVALAVALPDPNEEAAFILEDLLEDYLADDTAVLSQDTVRAAGLRHALVFVQTIMHD